MKAFVKSGLCLLSLVLLASMTACAIGGNGETTAPETLPETTAAPEDATFPELTVENPISYFSLSSGPNYNEIRSLTAYPDEEGRLHVEYVADVKKVGTVDPKLIHNLTQALADSGLAALNGAEVYAEGEAFGSMYITYEDGSFLAASYSGNVVKEFTDAYALMEDFFRTLTAPMEVYVPQPALVGEPDAAQLAALMQIMELSGLEPLDSFMISEVVKDEFFAYTLGLTSDEGIAAGSTCSAMMMTTPYGISLVTLEDPAQADAIRADFEKNLNWQKWVCVIPTHALIAQKDNMVLCLMGSDELFTKTEAAITAAGWTNIATFENPTA